MSLGQGSVTLIAAGFGVGGVLLGHYLTRSWQREQWRLDCRREEYRELITALSELFTNMQRSEMYMGSQDRALKLEVIKANAYRVIRDRILIAEELRGANILQRWGTAFHPVDHFSSNRQTWTKFADEYTAINDTLVKMALAPPPNFWTQRLKNLRARLSKRREP
jgi:hypothetical protein